MTTWLELKTEIEDEMDIDFSDDDFIDEAEAIRVANRAINTCSLIMYSMHQDYFLEDAYITLVDGTSAYAMPTNIFGNKLRFVQYNYNNERYEVPRIKLHEKADVDDNQDYLYDIENDYTDRTKFILYPASRISSATALRVWYIRKVNTVSGDSSVIDLPSDIYVKEKLRKYISVKEGNPMTEDSLRDLAEAKQLFIETFEIMIPDENKVLDMDLTHYEEHE